MLFMPNAAKHAFRLVTLMLLALPVSGWAYGAHAHQTIGFVAEAFICPETRHALAQLNPESIAEAGLWADQIRAYRQWDHVKPWHYINVSDDQAIIDAPRRRSGDVLWAIDEAAELLASPVVDQKQQLAMYRFLVHFIADVHQPLHVGRRSDLGGNRLKVMVDGRSSNLHSYWDSGVLGKVVETPEAHAERLVGTISAAAVVEWQASEPLQWAEESKSYRDFVYTISRSEAGLAVVTERYASRALRITEARMARAGVRLAGALDALYCNAKKGALEQLPESAPMVPASVALPPVNH